MVCELVKKLEEKLNLTQDVALLALRFMLAYTFFSPAMMKFSDLVAVAMWFDSLGIPLPTLNAYMAASTEMAGVILLSLGLGTRFISIALMFVLSVAIITVHGANGFAFIKEGSEVVNPYVNGTLVEGSIVVLQNGYELLLYYMLMLFVLISSGAGKISVDYLLERRFHH